MAKTSKKHLGEGDKERKKHKKHKNKHKAHKEHKHKKRPKEKKEKRHETDGQEGKVETTTEGQSSTTTLEKDNKKEEKVVMEKDDVAEDRDYEIPVALMKKQVPGMPGVYEDPQKLLTCELDPVTGRARLICATGQVFEEIVRPERDGQ